MATSTGKRKRSDTTTDGGRAGKSKPCPICGNEYSSQGLSSHKKACEKEKARRKAKEKYERSVWKEIEEATIASRSAEVPNRAIPEEGVAGPSSEPAVFDVGQIVDDVPDISIAQPEVLAEDQDVRLDDIRTIYHPSSGRATQIEHFEDYGRVEGGKMSAADLLVNKEPWKPFFPSLQDFSFAEVVLDGNLSRDQCERLINIINTCVQGRDTFNMKNYSDLVSMWERASEKLTTVQTSTITVPWDDEDQEFDMHYRPLWDWACDLLQDPQLAPHFEWDARKMSKFNGQSFVPFVDEPWTAKDFWEIQSNLPEGAKPLCFLLYADKSHLSTFGTEKGYPVIARCANLPVEIRNGNGLGGGRVVGWLPVVPEETSSKKGSKWVNFKRVVWHKAFYELLESIDLHSKTGCWFKCGDGVTRHLFPCILILSADYEEQCVMSLIRGLKGKCPCPICLVKPEELSDLTQSFPLRTAVRTQELVAKARGARTKKEAEATLKEYGLRNVDNVFWTINNSDPHHTLSFDRLHAYNGGLFGDHLWEVFKGDLNDMGNGADVAFEQRAWAMPRWSGLNHFPNILSISFSDGGKFEDIGKITVFVAYGLIKRDKRSPAWAMLCCIRSFAILDMYMSFEVHTEETIAAGRQELLKFGALIQQYRDLAMGSGKNWDFPKMHWHQHAFDNIEEKGVHRNFDTKPNEKLHGPLRKFYLRQTNKKDVATQILKLDHCSFIAKYIREQIDHAEEEEKAAREAEEDISAITMRKKSRRFFANNVVLGSQNPPCSFEDLEAEHQRLEAKNPKQVGFRGYRKRLATWLTASFKTYNIPLPGGTDIVFDKTDKVQEYQLLKVSYESLVDWRAKTDYLRCNPLFHGSPRYDFVIVDTVRGNIFAQLLHVFTCEVGDTIYPLALLLPFDPIAGPISRKDQDLGIYRVRCRPPESAEFFFAKSIIRGALLVEGNPDHDHCVMDTVDTDMFLRVQRIRESR